MNFLDHPNCTIDIVANTDSPVIIEMNGKHISGRGYRPCVNRTLLNVQCPNEINQQLTLLEIRGYAHLDYGKCVF